MHLLNTKDSEGDRQKDRLNVLHPLHFSTVLYSVLRTHVQVTVLLKRANGGWFCNLAKRDIYWNHFIRVDQGL